MHQILGHWSTFNREKQQCVVSVAYIICIYILVQRILLIWDIEIHLIELTESAVLDFIVYTYIIKYTLYKFVILVNIDRRSSSQNIYIFLICNSDQVDDAVRMETLTQSYDYKIKSWCVLLLDSSLFSLAVCLITYVHIYIYSLSVYILPCHLNHL